MSFQFFLNGLMIGFAIAAPVGPIGVLCIRRTLSNGRLIGFLSGLGAATADALYGSLAAFGLTALTDLLVDQRDWLRIIGGLFLVYLGVKTFFDRPATPASSPDAAEMGGAFTSTFVLTLTNPMTILSFLAIFTGLRILEAGSDLVSAASMVSGVFIGSAAWWFILSSLVGIFRNRLTQSSMIWINRLAGAVILIFGVSALFFT